MDRILESPRFPNDGNGTVAQGDELAETARFIPRRHEEHIRCRIDLMGQGFIEHDVGRNLVGMAVGQFPEGIFIASIAGPDQDQLDFVVDEFVHDAHDEIEALVFNEARDHGDERHAALDAKAQFFPQGVFIFPLIGRAVATEYCFLM